MTPNTLKAIRHKLKMTQKELAKAIGKCERTVQRWELGETAIPALAADWLKRQVK